MRFPCWFSLEPLLEGFESLEIEYYISMTQILKNKQVQPIDLT